VPKTKTKRARKKRQSHVQRHAFQINVVRPNLIRAVEQAEELLAGTLSLDYFRRGMELVKPSVLSKRTEDELFGFTREKGSVILQPATKELIVRDVMRNSDCFVSDENGGTRSADFPPYFATHVLDKARRGEGKYRLLYLVSNTPILTSFEHGTILTEPGYREGVLMVPSRVKYPAVPDVVTPEMARAALDEFAEVYKCFPFKASAPNQKWDETPSYAAVLASVLTLVARPALPIVPRFGITAPTRGFGKTKISEAACCAALGVKPTLMGFPNQIEFDKALVPLMQAADRGICIDNIDIPFHSGMFCALLTTDTAYQARILGHSRTASLLNASVFFATGNQLSIKGDLTRRAVMISVGDDCEYPERRYFEFDPVEAAKELHPQLCVAALTALRGYLQAGHPWMLQRTELQDFWHWDRLVTGTLTWLKFADPLLTRTDVEESDPQREEDLQLLTVWHENYPQPMTVPELQAAGEFGSLWPMLAPDGRWDNAKVGYRLRTLNGKVVCGYKLKRLPVLSHGCTLWTVTKDGKPPEPKQSVEAPSEETVFP